MKKLIFGVMSGLLFAMLASVCVAGSSTDKAFTDNIRAADGKVGISATDLKFDIPADREADFHGINQFGHASDGVQATATDIWDRADSDATQQIWVAPSSAAPLEIASSSASDASAGAGARKLRIYGLIDWDLPEISEDIVMNGTTSVTTTQSWVVCYQMQVIEKGATNVNVGTITAKVQGESTVTAVISPSEGKTQMAVYAISSLDEAYITNFYGTINKAQGVAATIDYSLRVNTEPDTQLSNFVRESILGVQSTGSSLFSHSFFPYLRVNGPAVIKVQGIASAADVDGSAGIGIIRWTDTSGFDAVLASAKRDRGPLRIITTADGRVVRTSQDIPN
jgi:hypothetical protein